MKAPLISVITVVYNNCEGIVATLDSVVGQTFTDFEYVVIDGKSTDGTQDVVKNYLSQIAHYVSESDSGIYNAMNKGIEASKGDYCIFMNSGDIFSSSTILDEISMYLKDKHYPIVYGDVITVDGNGNQRLKEAESYGNKHRMYFCHQSVFTRRDVLTKYKFDEKYRMSADFKFFKQCYYGGCEFLHVKSPVSIFNLTGVSKTRRLEGLKENIKIINEIDRGIERIRLLFRTAPSYFMKWLRVKLIN